MKQTELGGTERRSLGILDRSVFSQRYGSKGQSTAVCNEEAERAKAVLA